MSDITIDIEDAIAVTVDVDQAANGATGPAGPAGVPGSTTFAGLTDSPNDNALLDAALDAKQDALGFTPENAANKQTILAASSTQYPNADAVIAAIAAIPIGSQASFFISSKASLIPGYGMFSATPYGIAETQFSAVCTEINTEYLIKAFATNGNLAATHIPAGLWSFHTNVRVSASGGVTNLVYRVYKRTPAGVETELFSVVSAEIDNTTNEVVETDYVIPAAISKNLEDAIVVKVFAKSTSTADRTVYILTDGTAHASHVETTLGSGFDPDAPETITAPWDFTDALTKNGVDVATVNDIPVSHFLGLYVSLVALQAAHATANDGDYAIVDPGTGVEALQYIWDGQEGWVASAVGSPSTTDDVTEGSVNLYFTAARVRSTLLTGLSLATAQEIAATDTFLQALGYLQAQLGAKANLLLANFTQLQLAGKEVPAYTYGSNANGWWIKLFDKDGNIVMCLQYTPDKTSASGGSYFDFPTPMPTTSYKVWGGTNEGRIITGQVVDVNQFFGLIRLYNNTNVSFIGWYISMWVKS